MNCSGNGVLRDDGGCDCFSGWTSIGDMRASTQGSCDISLIFVRCVYAFPLLLFPVAAYHSGKELYLLHRLKGSWKRLCRFSNKVFVIHFTTILSSILLSVAYIEKIVRPERVIGLDSTVTWLFFIGMAFFFIVIASAFELFVRISIKQERFGGSKGILWLLSFARYLIPFMSLMMLSAFSLVVVAVYVRPYGIVYVENLFQGFWLVLGATALMLLIGTPIILHSACRDLDAMVKRHNSDGKADDIARLSKKLGGIRRQSIVRGILNTGSFFAMGLSSEARGPYVIGVQALLFSVIVLGLSTLTSTKSTGSSSSKPSQHLLGSKASKQRLRDLSKDEESSKRSSKEDIGAYLGPLDSPSSKSKTESEQQRIMVMTGSVIL